MIIFIGGPPRVGKSFLVRHLFNKLHISHTSTDTLRHAVKKLKQIPQKDPLFILDNLKAEKNRKEFSAKHSIEEVIDIQNTESKEVVKVVKGFVEWVDYHKQDFIIEGVALLPEFFDKEFLIKHNIKFFTIGNTDFSTFLEYSWEHRIHGDWLEEVDEETFEKVIRFCAEFSKVFKKQSEERNIPYFEIDSTKFKNEIEKISQLIISSTHV